MTWKWFLSRTVRQAHNATRHVQKLVEHQRDLLSPEAIQALHNEVQNVRRTYQTGTKAAIMESVGQLEKAANKWLKPYPNAAWRENIEVLLVAIAVAMGIRTFFLQPFKIPTGSMQPTLYGVTDENLAGRSDVKPPGFLGGLAEYWFRGVSYKKVVAKGPGQLVAYDKQPSKFILFNLKQTFQVGNHTYTVWFPPDNLLVRAGLVDPYDRVFAREFQAGEDIINLRIISGDHLFVDRMTYNFRRPDRGDIVVFETHGIYRLKPDQQNTYYIKRLVGLGGERLSIDPDYELISPEGVPLGAQVGHLVVNGRDITAGTPRFEHLYSFIHAERGTNTLRYLENHYHGHWATEELAVGREVQVSPDHYYVLGDNTMSSSDSRYWGDFPRDRVIGKSFFVYWPIGGTKFKGEERPSRFGWSHR